MPLAAGVLFCAGAGTKCNWVYVRPVAGARRCIVFFPGDLSDFAAGGGLPYSYSLDALLWALCRKFPDDTVVLVKPRWLVDRFAIYVNFVLVDGMGNPRPLSETRGRAPEPAEALGDGPAAAAATPPAADEPGVEQPHAVQHLERLLESVKAELKGELPPTLTLVGFSKGAVVLGALLREAPTEAAFWGAVDAVHFVDAGLTVPGSIFPVDEQALEALKRAARGDFTLWLHGTPRQWEDEGRPFVAEETAAFERRGRAAGLRVERRLYAAGQPPSLNQHFDCICCFCTGDAAAGEQAAGDGQLGFFAEWTAACG